MRQLTYSVYEYDFNNKNGVATPNSNEVTTPNA